jgi:glucokinase
VTSVRAGVDLGATKIQAVVVGDDHAVLGEAKTETPTSGGPQAVVAKIEGTVREAAKGAGLDVDGLSGAGVGSPGAVDQEAGTVAHARNLPDWDEPFPLAEALGDALGTTVRIENDVKVAVTAELELGAGRRYESFLGVWWGTGVGGGIVLDRKLWRGRGAAGEIGHMVVKRGGARCPCGRRGCLEAYAGRGAMEAHARKLVKHGRKTDLFELMEKRKRDRLTSGVWADALERKDELATALLDRAVAALGAGIGSAVNLLDVEAVIVGGGLGTRLGEPYVRRIAEAARPHLFVDERPPAMLTAALGDLGGAIGAALLVGPA